MQIEDFEVFCTFLPVGALLGAWVWKSWVAYVSIPTCGDVHVIRVIVASKP